jgi:hypothetical protein
MRQSWHSHGTVRKGWHAKVNMPPLSRSTTSPCVRTKSTARQNTVSPVIPHPVPDPATRGGDNQSRCNVWLLGYCVNTDVPSLDPPLHQILCNKDASHACSGVGCTWTYQSLSRPHKVTNTLKQSHMVSSHVSTRGQWQAACAALQNSRQGHHNSGGHDNYDHGETSTLHYATATAAAPARNSTPTHHTAFTTKRCNSITSTRQQALSQGRCPCRTACACCVHGMRMALFLMICAQHLHGAVQRIPQNEMQAPSYCHSKVHSTWQRCMQ